MNPILHVKLRFINEKNKSKSSGKKLRSTAETTVEKIDFLINNLEKILEFYSTTENYIKGILIDANYNDIIAKSRRISSLLKPKGKNTNDCIVGARFSNDKEFEENHIITYYIDEHTVKKTISELKETKRFIDEKLRGVATSNNFNELTNSAIYKGYKISKTTIRNIIVDSSVIESFSIPNFSEVIDKENVLITLYKTEKSLSEILTKLEIDKSNYRYVNYGYGENTISASKEVVDILKEKVPYMISMISSDLSKIQLEDIEIEEIPNMEIPSPTNEPTIGVIDTLMDTGVYFSEWVENIDYLDEVEKKIYGNYNREHGTEVSSIIVDGPRYNPWLDDGCGRFKVRHFGVCEDRISPSRLVRKIKEIVNKNTDIHVWNLSLGTEDEVSKNFISFDASILDEIQTQKNVIFVVSGTNDNRINGSEIKDFLRIGSPADSLNSLVVNSAKRDGSPVSYSRKGNVLSFFNKPDVSYYGGDYNERIKAFSPTKGICEVYGTSYAAPWLSRKLCYLIDVMRIPREVAKALIIDSAAGWNYKNDNYKNKDIIGYGVVPININDILTSKKDEIKFWIYDSSSSYKTTNYDIPIPKDSNNNYPYVARATICYFPECNREQGIDYTSRELSLNFGRVDKNGKIKDINENIQDDDAFHVDERKSRTEFRKWENTKFISKVLKDNPRPLKSYEDRLWGISIVSKERLSSRIGKEMNFGVVVTLKEINGINRIEDFVTACKFRSYIVNKIEVQNRIDIYNTIHEEITLK